MVIIFNDTSEQEATYRAWAPPTVYKYREWKTQNHKDMLAKQQVWFAHPVTLNDTKDLRPEYAYNQAEIESQDYFEKLLASAPEQFPHVADRHALYRIAYDQWQLTIADPRDIFDSARKTIETDEHFDPYGVFSTSTNDLSKPTWELYADNFAGYCMGFDTTGLWKQMNCTTGHLVYSNDPFPFSFLKDDTENDVDILLYKSTQWAYEEEFRFATVAFPSPLRLRTFTPDIVTEVIIGHNMPVAHETELIGILKAQYRPDLSVYKTALDADGTVSKFLITIV